MKRVERWLVGGLWTPALFSVISISSYKLILYSCMAGQGIGCLGLKTVTLLITLDDERSTFANNSEHTGIVCAALCVTSGGSRQRYIVFY